MVMRVIPSGQICGARVEGVDLSRPLAREMVSELRRAWLTHKVLAFPDQALDLAALERASQLFGPFGDDPFIAPIEGHPHVIEVRREPDEKTPLLAETWHSDWSFLAAPPAGTMLYGRIIPPMGGDTLFGDMTAAYRALSPEMKERIGALFGVHSAARGYSKAGLYGDQDKGRSMAIRPSDAALAEQAHPIVRAHPETGEPALFVNMGYTKGIAGMTEQEGWALLLDLFKHQTQPDFVYRHRWAPGMLTLWDNRCLIHMATGGYDGHRRLLWRTTIAEAA
jgi:taurine dioxygenase